MSDSVPPKASEVMELSPADRALLKELAGVQTAATQEFERRKVLARFESRNLSVETIAAIAQSTKDFRDQAEIIFEVTKPGREQSAALTALEEAKFWTNQSIALNGELARVYGDGEGLFA